MNIKHSKKTLISFLTALSISLGASGCSNYQVKETKKEVTKQDDNLSSPTLTPTPTLTPKQQEAIKLKKMVDEYLDYFNSCEVEYPNEEYYPTKKEIKKIISIYDTYKEYDHKDSISMKELFKMVRKNSNKYAEKHQEYESAFPDVNSKNYISQVHNVFAFKVLLKEWQKNSTNDFSEDICKMKDLKIVFGDLNKNPDGFIYCGQYLGDKNLIILDNKAVNDLEKSGRIFSETDKYKTTLDHELFHTTSVSCKHKMKKGQKFSSFLSFSALFESAAESSTYAADDYFDCYYGVNSYDFSYVDEREDESLILLLGLFHDNKTCDDYYNAIKDSNPKAFYDFCGVKTEKEKINLFKIIAAIDGRNGFNSIVFNVKNADFLTMEKLNKGIRYNYKIDIFNKVLSNMIDYTINNSDFTIEKNILMLNIIENCLLDDTTYFNKKNSYDQNFVVDFYNSEAKYLEFLSQYYFKGKKNSNYIKKNYEYEYIEYDAFHSLKENNYNDELVKEFPLLKPILFSHEDAIYSNECFFVNNKKIIKEKCKTK